MYGSQCQQNYGAQQQKSSACHDSLSQKTQHKKNDQDVKGRQHEKDNLTAKR
jgi:hypothetical protein